MPLLALLIAKSLEKYPRQQQRVTLAIFQGRDGNRDLTDTVIKIFAKLVNSNQLMQVLVCCTQHAHINRDFLASANTFYDALLQKSQQLGL